MGKQGFHLKCDKSIMHHETQDIFSSHSVYEHSIKPPLTCHHSNETMTKR